MWARPTFGANANLLRPLDGRVAPRSGLALKHGIDTLAGVIDADYRGPVGVILANLSDKDFPVKIGDRIAQLIVERVVMPSVVVVEQLEDTVRGAGGFGSTGGFGAAAAVATQAAVTATEAADDAEIAGAGSLKA
jgi:dUTP pyrophosphatase